MAELFTTKRLLLNANVMSAPAGTDLIIRTSARGSDVSVVKHSNDYSLNTFYDASIFVFSIRNMRVPSGSYGRLVSPRSYQ